MLLGDRSSMTVDTSSPLPYDYEVEYIQRDYGIAWTEGGAGARGGFDLLEYLPEGGQGSWNVSWEAQTCGESYGTPSAGQIGPVVVFMSGFLGFQMMRVAGFPCEYSFQHGSGNTSAGAADLDSWHVMKTSISNGVYVNAFDGVDVGSGAISYTTAPSIRLVLGSVNQDGTGGPYRVRIKGFKFGDKVDFIPVVMGEQCGFYNKVDGALFLAKQDCLTAGPAVK